MSTTPHHAPYTVALDDQVEVRVWQNEDGIIIGEVEFNGDKIGGSIDPEDLGGVPLPVVVDEMVAGLARYVWHELAGFPVFPEESAEWTGRVEVQSPWLREKRTPTLGLIANTDVLGAPEPVLEPEVAAAPEVATPDLTGVVHAEVAVGTANVAMTTEEMREVARGSMPESFLARVVAAMEDDELVAAIRRYIELESDADPIEMPERDQAARALAEIERRIGS